MGARRPPLRDGVLHEGRGPKISFPLVGDLAVDGFPVTVRCRVLGLSTQAYSRRLADPVRQRAWVDAHLLSAITDVHRDDPEFGDGFIADEVQRLGHTESENRIQRLCALQQVASSTIPEASRVREAFQS